ncbi:MAG: DUF4349 domain-containing protein [Armatimonadota bacterium]|nr:DUF4349 domain-containing protein [Armatimonadota bacterium]
MKLWLVLALTLLVLTGCAQNAPRVAGDRAASSMSGPPSLEKSAAPETTPAVRPRMIIQTAQMSIVAKDPATTLQSLSALADTQGGYVSDSKQWRENGQMRATMTLRVPAKLLLPTMAAIRRAGLRTESESLSGQDVSQEYSDLSAQLTNLEATERELRLLLATVRQRTQRASDVLDVFNQLAKVRGEIEQTKGRMLNMSQLADLATINLEIVPDALAQPLTEAGWHPVGVVRDAFRALVATLKWVFEALIWAGIYVAPLAVIGAGLVFLVRRLARRLRRRPERLP